IHKSSGSIAAAGGQVVLSYDTNVLQYMGGVPGHGNVSDSFNTEFWDEEPSSGLVEYASGINPFGGAPVADAADIATLTFHVIHGATHDACSAAGLISFVPGGDPGRHRLN